MEKQQQQMDAATLAAVNQFLSEYESAGTVDVAHQSPTVPAVDELLLASQLHVSETEASLAQSSVDENTSDSDRNATQQSPRQTKAERRRKITNAQAAKRRVKYLKRVKDKRETLKREARELADELHRMKSARVRAKEEAEKADALALSVWRATCVRQKERRLESEELQRQLKAAVISRAKLIHQMHSLLQHRMAGSQVESLLALEGSQSSAWEKKGTALFKTFVHELDAIYAQTDEVIENSDLKFSSSLMYKRTWKWNQGMTFLESADATVIPFGFEKAKHAVSFAMLSDPRENPHSEGIEDPENTTASTYRLNYSWESGDSVTFVVYCAIRRYVEADRVVFVWRARSEGQGEFDGLAMDETVWVVVRPSDAPTQDNPATVLEIYTRLVPTGFGGPSAPPRFVKMFVRSDEEDISYMMRLLEKLLIHQTNSDGRAVSV